MCVVNLTLRWILVVWVALEAGVIWAGSDGNPSLKVRLTDKFGVELNTERYVAILAPNSTFKEPYAETLLPQGMPVPTWKVQPGTYKAFCSASGYGSAFGDSVTVSEEEPMMVAFCQLTPLISMKGRVVDQHGNPVFEAEIGPLRAFLPDHPQRWSDLGEQHAHSVFTTKTKADGHFDLSVVPNSRTTLMAAREGQGLALLANILTAPIDGSVPDIVMSNAGRLVVQLPREAGENTGLSWRVRLLPKLSVDASWRREVPLGFWSRDVLAGGSVTWPTIPTGDYTVVLDGPPLARNGFPPQPMGIATVAPGSSKEFVLAYENLAMAAKNLNHVVTWRLVTRLGAVIPPDLRIVSFDPTTFELVIHAFQIGTSDSYSAPLKVVGPCIAGRQMFAISDDGWFAEAPKLTTEFCESAHQIPEAPLLPAAQIVGKLKAPDGHSLPTEGVVLLYPCGEDKQDAAESARAVPLMIQNDGAFQVIAPPGCFDVVLNFAEFLSEKLYGLELAPVGRVDVGSRHLIPASSVNVRVVDQISRQGVQAEVFLIPTSHAGGQSLDLIERLRTVGMNHRCSANDDGWCRFSGIPAGKYRLISQADGYAMAIGAEFTVRGADAKSLTDLLMLRPGAIHVDLTSDILWNGSKMIDSFLQISPDNWCAAASSLERNIELSGNNSEIISEVIPGQWQVKLFVQEPGEVIRIIDEVRIEVAPGQTTEVKPGAGFVVFAGEVTMRGEPLVASLAFWATGKSDSGVTQSRDEGDFEVFLPGPGIYSVDITSEDGSVTTTVQNVEVKSEELLQIVVPGSQIGGRVLTKNGEPVENASVIATQESRSSRDQKFLKATAVSDSSGAFELAGLKHGFWALEANDRRRRSKTTEVELGEIDSVDGVTLILRETEVIHGTILGPFGVPEVGVKVAVTNSPTTQSQATFIRWFSTDATGTVMLQRSDAPANIEVCSKSVGVQPAVVGLEEDFEINLTETFGALIIRPATGSLTEVNRMNLALVREGGGFLSIDNGLNDGKWAQQNGTRIVIPRLASGIWHVGSVLQTVENLVPRMFRGDLSVLTNAQTFELLQGITMEIEIP